MVTKKEKEATIKKINLLARKGVSTLFKEKRILPNDDMREVYELIYANGIIEGMCQGMKEANVITSGK